MKRIPALTLSGGTLKRLKDAKEFRIWVHPKKGGDDYYYSFPNISDVAYRSKYKGGYYKKDGVTEKPLAVIWDKKFKKYREVQIPAKMLRKVY